MPLDPRVEQIVYWASRARSPAYQAAGAELARALYRKACVPLDIAPVAMRRIDDLAPHGEHAPLRVRRYLPATACEPPLPALLYFHGGGFTIGSPDTHDRVCRRLADGAGCAVFSVDYRLAPEHRFPAAVDDAFAALAWLREDARANGVDARRIAVGGDSAGGTLAAATALHARDRDWPLALQLLIYPGLIDRPSTESHTEFARGYLLDADLIAWFMSNYLRSDADRDDWRFAPLRHPELRGVAPAWFGLAEYDPLRDEGLLYARRLEQAGVRVQATVYPGMIHAFFQYGGFVPLARQAHADASEALRRALTG